MTYLSPDGFAGQDQDLTQLIEVEWKPVEALEHQTNKFVVEMAGWEHFAQVLHCFLNQLCVPCTQFQSDGHID